MAGEGAAISAPIPILRIFSVDLAWAFYRDWLGCRIDWEYRHGDDFPLYCQVSRGPLVLHLTEHAGDASPGARLFIPTGDLRALHAELASRPWRLGRPGIDEREWGLELTLTDPFGNRLTFCQQGG